MRARGVVAILGLILLTPAFAGAARGGSPDAPRFGVGAHGIVNVPIAQDDAGVGFLYGLHARAAPIALLQVEASATVLDNGNRTTTASGRELRLEAPEMSTFALDLLLSLAHLRSAAVVLSGGVGWTDLDVPGGAGRRRHLTTNAGLEIELSRAPLGIGIGPKVYVIDLGGATRKNLGVLAGVTYYLP